MIILDTCILRGIRLDSSSADLLRAIQRAGVERVSVPWVAMEELVAQKAVKYREKHQAAAESLRALKGAVPWELAVKLDPLDEEKIRDYWRQEYGTIVDTIPTEESALKEATFREANGLAPCKFVRQGSRPVKTGYRDAAIWVSAIEFAQKYLGQTVYFVSSNTDDFGDGSAYLYPMNDDLAAIGDRFVHLTSLTEVIDRFARPVESNEARVQAILESKELRPVIVDHMMSRTDNGNGSTAFECTAAAGSLGELLLATTAQNWIGSPMVQLRSTQEVNTYRIGEQEWSTARASWLLYGLALVGSDPSVAIAACSWDTRVLLAPTQVDDPRLTILGSFPPATVPEAEFDSAPGISRTAPVHARELLNNLTDSNIETVLREVTSNTAEQRADVWLKLLHQWGSQRR